MTSATGFIAPFFFEQFRYPNGNPLGNGYIESYVSETMIPKRLFSDVYLQIPHTNPMYLDASGFVPEYYMEEGLYTLVLKSAEGLTIATRDNVRGSVGSGQNMSGQYLPLAGGTMTGTIISEANIIMGDLNSGMSDVRAPILVVGSGNATSSSNNVTMIGNYNEIYASNYSNMFGGAYNLISGSYQSTVMGGWYNDIVDGSTMSTVIGGQNNQITNGEESAILGGRFNDIVNADRSVAIGGIGLQAFYDDQVVIGAYNYPSNQALIIGNGTSDGARNNAFTVSQAGDVNAVSYAGDTIQIGNVSNTEFQRLDGVSANIQSQLSTLSANAHTHSNKELLDLINQDLNTSADVQFDTLSANIINVGKNNIIGNLTSASIKGTSYAVITMPDGKRWMAENLNWTDLGTPGYYGQLYSYSDISGVDFGDWRVPTPDEMFAMVDSVPGVSWWNGPYSSNARANFFRSTEWNGDNFSQMNFLPAGYYDGTLQGYNSSLMLCSPLDEVNYTLYENGIAGDPAAMWLAGNDPYVYRKGALPTYGYSVRLIYDPVESTNENYLFYGNHLSSETPGQFILGSYNANVPTNVVEIGAGTSELDRKNIFAIDNMGGVSATELELGVTVMGTEDPATLPMHFRVEGGTDSWWPNILTLQSNSEKYTIAQLQAPWQDDITVGEREATFTLMRADRDGSSEFLDLYNNHYDASKIMGLVIQKRGAGVLRNFYFGTYGGSGPANAQFENDIALIDNTNKEWKFWYPIRTENGIKITDNVPVDTSATLYNSAGTLYWDGSPITNRRYATTINIAASYGQTFTITHNLGYLRPNINITYGVTGEMILIDPTYISVNQLSFVINSKKVMNNVNVEVSF